MSKAEEIIKRSIDASHIPKSELTVAAEVKREKEQREAESKGIPYQHPHIPQEPKPFTKADGFKYPKKYYPIAYSNDDNRARGVGHSRYSHSLGHLSISLAFSEGSASQSVR